MTASSESLAAAHARHVTYRREDAARAIEVAMASLQPRQATSEQIGDLADAIDAFKQQEFYVAALLARGAMHSKPLEGYARPATQSRTLDQVREEFRALCGNPGT